MEIENVPKLKDASKTERITIPVDKETKQKLYELKAKHRIDVTEWIRQLIAQELLALNKTL